MKDCPRPTTENADHSQYFPPSWRTLYELTKQHWTPPPPGMARAARPLVMPAPQVSTHLVWTPKRIDRALQVISRTDIGEKGVIKGKSPARYSVWLYSSLGEPLPGCPQTPSVPSAGNQIERLSVWLMGAGESIMPSSEYFRRQSYVCLRLSLISSSEEVASRLIVMAQGYKPSPKRSTQCRERRYAQSSRRMGIE
jgi:hypothetical protein